MKKSANDVLTTRAHQAVSADAAIALTLTAEMSDEERADALVKLTRHAHALNNSAKVLTLPEEDTSTRYSSCLALN